MRTDALVVVLVGQVAGLIRRTGGQMTFEYDIGYRRSAVIPLSPALPIGDRVFKNDQIGAFIDGLLPDNDQTRQRWANMLGTTSDPMDLLAGMGQDCAGAVQFATEANVPAILGREGRYESITEQAIGERLRVLRTDEAAWALPDEHWSLAGAQEKFTLARIGNRWSEAKGSAPTTHIVKPGIRRMRHQALVEHVTMRSARILGISVAATRFATFDGEEALVVDRYDRLPGEQVQRLHQVDFCQAVGARPQDKYEARGGPRARDLVRMLRAHSTSPERDVARFSDALAFNYLSGSPDGHAKNFALLYAGTRVRLAPLYDMATALPYDQNQSGLDLRTSAFAIGDRRRFGDVYRGQWELHAESFGLPISDRLDRFEDLAQRIPGAFAEALDAIGGDASANIARRLTSKLEQHCSNALKGLRRG